MMQDANPDKPSKGPRTIEIGQGNGDSTTASATAAGKSVVDPHSNFGPDMSGSDDDEASEVDSFVLDENDIEENEQGLEATKFLLAAEAEGQGIQTVDPQTQARLEALLEAAGINKLSSKDGKALSDPEVLRTLTSSVSSALDEAAQALHRMRDSQGQVVAADGVPLEPGSDNEPLGHRSGSSNAADTTEEGESLLSLACSAGYYELAQVLLAMKANVEDRGIKGDCTPLMEAASGGHVDIVRLLLLHHADINAQSSAGNTPLHYGACGGFKEVVEELMLNGANVEIHNENGHTPLMEAASAGHVEVAKILLEHGAGINTHSNEFKESALTLACYKGHLDMVKFLLEAGADQEHKTDEMHTALMEASMDGHVEVARLLLDSGAQVNMPADSFESPLTLAACGGHIELASLLIERGAYIEEVNDEGYTPLMEAAREGHEDMVALLLSQGAEINAQTEETQETALTLACCGGFLEVADFLLRSGALIELGCSTPLMEAAQEGHLELVSFLLQSGANVEAQTGTGDTALTYACENGHTDVAEALLECGAKLEHESEGGRTPLMKAARAGHLCTVQFLISKGADVNRTTTSNDHTVLSLACAGGHLAVVELLLQHGADVNHKLKDGSTMVIEAAKGGHTQVVKLLLEWPSRFLVNTATEQLAQLSVADAPLEEPRVPVQGLANIVPPSEPDSQIPLSTTTLASAIQAKNPELIHQTMQKPVKRVANGQSDVKGGNKFCNNVISENFQPFFNDTSLIEDKSVIDKLPVSQGSKEDQIFRKQQILEELKKVELELQEKAQTQMLLTSPHEMEQQHQQKLKQTGSSSTSAVSTANTVNATAASAVTKAEQLAKQNEELAKLLDIQSQPMLTDINLDQRLTDFAKLVACTEFGASNNACTEECLQQVHAHLQQQQQQLLLQQQAPNQLPLPPTTSVASTTSSTSSAESRGGGGAVKNQGNKRTASNKQSRVSKSSQPSQQPPPPPPPPPLPVVQQVKSPILLPLVTQQQAIFSPTQPVVFQTEHNGGAQSTPSQIVASPTEVMLDPTQRHLHALSQQIQSHQLTAQQQQQQLLAYPQLLPQQQEQLLQHMLIQPGLQHQLQMQQITQQVQSGQQVLQSVSSSQGISAATPTHLSQQQQQMFQQQQQQAQQLLQHQLQQLQPKSPATSGNSTIAINKPQVVRKQRVVQTTTQTVLHQNSIVNVDGTTLPHANTQALGVAGATTGTNPLNTNVDVDSQTESNHDTALTLACAGGHAELVSLLLAKGADIEHRDKKGFTPLILAATAGHVDVVEILLDHNADIEAKSERTNDTPLSLACSGGRYEVVELLLSRDANKEHRNVSDYTPLSLAASGGYVNIIKLLLSHNAEINSRTGSKLGISPLMLAAMNGHTAAVKLLLDMGSDINAQIETNRNTALTLACFQGRHEVVSLLVDRKANIEHRAKTGLTPLMEAASGGYVEVGRVLLDKGADVNAPPVPSSRDTALTIAADKGHYRFVELLLHRGASVDVKNKKGNSPLWLACNGGHSDVVSLLVQADADIDSQDNRKVSCLMAAFRRGHIKVVKWLVKKVTQFPSENEIKRYIATITDKELQKKCNQCADVIVTAKDRQAAEANKNADILLEEIQQEKEQAALKAEMASKRRERRRERKKKGKQKTEKSTKDKDSGKNSSPEPEGDSSNKRDDNDDEEDDDSNSEPPSTVNKMDNISSNKGPKGKGTSSQPQLPTENQQLPRLPADVTSETVTASVASRVVTSTVATPSSAAAARANRDARKKLMKASRENRREASDQDAGLRHVKVELCKKQVTRALEVTMAKVTTLIESVVTVTAMSPQASLGSITKVTSSTGASMKHSTSTKPAPVSHVSEESSSQLSNFTSTVNGAGSKTRIKKSTDILKQSSSTGIGDLDDFEVFPLSNMIKNLDKINGKTPLKKLSNANDNKTKDWVSESSFFEKNQVSNRLATSARSPRKGQGKEEGWKEVVRKNMSKKLSVPGNVISRLIGKGGCNINKIREVSGAHVEVEKSKGNADRTVTIKGYPEAIRQANNLINAMVEEPDKDISELLARTSKGQKSPSEKPPPPAPVPKAAPVSIADFAIGTFTVPITVSSSNTGNSSTKSPAQAKSNRSSRSSNSNPLAGTIGAWQNPVPGQVIPASPRRSPQKQVTPSPNIGSRSTTAPSSEKNSARQLTFGGAGSNERKRSTSPISTSSVSSAALNFTTAATSTIRGVVSSSTIVTTQPHAKLQDPRVSGQVKTSHAAAGSATSNSAPRFPRPSQPTSSRMEPMPLPIVSSGSGHTERERSGQPSGGSGGGTQMNQTTPGEYSPFNNNLFTNFLTKKEEQSDKMDFASVAAAGVVTTSPSPQTTSSPTIATSNNTVDPALQAKAPGFKIPQRGNSPPYRPPEVEPGMGTYRMPVPPGVMPGTNGPIPSMSPSNMAPGNIRQGMPIHQSYMENEYMLHIQQLNQIRENQMIHYMNMDPVHSGMSIPGGIIHQGINNMGMNLNQHHNYQQTLTQMVQKDEYSQPHRPMTLPEIKGALNPNAPEFQLPNSGPPMINGYDRSSRLLSGMMGLQQLMPEASARIMGHDNSSPNASPNNGLSGLNQGNMPPVMSGGEMLGPGVANMPFLLQQIRPNSGTGGGLVGSGNPGSSPPQVGQTRMAAVPNAHGSPPQSMSGPPGMAPGSNFLSQSQPPRAHSPMQNLPGGRPNSAPSVQPDPSLMGSARSASPLLTRTPPLELVKQTIQPIGGERKKGPVRTVPVSNTGSYGNLWGNFNNTGGNMAYRMDAEEEVIDYPGQTQAQYEAGVQGSGDGDHNGLGQNPGMMVPGMYSNGPYPMGPMFPPKGAGGDSQTPLWSSAMTTAPTEANDNERWQSWNQ